MSFGMALQLLKQLLRTNRFRDEVHTAGIKRGLSRISERTRGYHDDGYRFSGWLGEDLACGLQSVEVVHSQVHENNVRLMFRCQRDSLNPSARCNNMHACALEKTCQNTTIH